MVPGADMAPAQVSLHDLPLSDQGGLRLRLDQDTLAYFKALAAQNGVPYQTLINLYLRDCATSGKKLVFR